MPKTSPDYEPQATTTEHAIAEIAQLVEQADVAAAARLLDIAESSDKVVAKAAKRALYKLKTTGIEPSPVTASELSAKQGTTSTLARRAMMTQPGGTGSRMLLFVRDDPHGGSPTLISFLINDERGLLDLGSKKLSRKQLEENISSFAAKESTILAEIDLDYARHVLAQAAELRLKTRRTLQSGYSNLQSLIGVPRRGYDQSPVYDVLDSEKVKNDLSISRSPEALLDKPWFRGWLLDMREIAPWLEKILDVEESRLVLDESQKNQRGERVIDDVTDELITGNSILIWRRRLEESALVLHLSGRAVEASEAFYQALSLHESSSPHLLPFLRAIVKRSVGVAFAMLQENEEKKEQTPGLIERI